jgi:alkylated DNA repair dioxygenase AlkB
LEKSNDRQGSVTPPVPTAMIGGASLYENWLDRTAQSALVAELRDLIAVAPLFSPLTAWGKPMSVKMTSAGCFGWFSDRKGYRYVDRHPSGSAWPPIPQAVLAIWHALCSAEREPDCCLINWYGPGARMGLHQDRDEADFNAGQSCRSALGTTACSGSGAPSGAGPRKASGCALAMCWCSEAHQGSPIMASTGSRPGPRPFSTLRAGST